MTQKTSQGKKHSHVVIVGGNFAGLSAASKLAHKAHIGVTLVDPAGTFNWTPNIHEIVSGLKDPGSVAISSEKNAARLGYRFVCERATALDSPNNSLELESGEILDYDVLLLSCGLSTAGLDTPGAAQSSIGLRRAEQAKRIQQRIAVALANNKSYTITIVGAGFTGIEVLGELLRRHAGDERVSVNVVDTAPRILAGLPEVIGQDVQKHCEQFPVHFHLSAEIGSVEEKAVLLQDGTSIDSDLTIWCAGTRLPDFIAKSDLAQDRSGVLVVDTLQCQSAENIFAAGDIAATPKPIKKQATYAIDMGKQAAGNIEQFLRGEPGRAFVPFQKPLLLSFGDINTYFIYNNAVFASPLLAPLKEAVYQFYMTQFAANLPAAEQGLGIVGRYARSVRELLLPELLRFRFGELLGRSRRLQ
ncbi:MAG: FAD-dependent oxidoreductase [Pseudomonadales bacterium]